MKLDVYGNRAKFCSGVFLIAALVLVIAASGTWGADDLPGTGPLPAKPTVTEKVVVQTDLVYGKAENEKLLCDLYLPKEPHVPRPAILFIHGGGWAVGNKRQVWPVYPQFAEEGFVVMSINYRLKKPYPAAVNDCQRAVRWLRAHAREYNVDPDKIGATGQSAGGHLASLLGVMDTLHSAGDDLDRYSSRVQAVVNQFGPSQVSAGDFGYGIPFQFDESCKCKGDINREASPLFHVDARAAPFLLIQGNKDTTVNPENMICLARALYRANVEVIMMIWPNTGHGNGTYDPLVWQEASRFFKRHLGHGP